MISDILCMPCAHIIDKINTLHLKYIAPNKIRNSKTKIILERFRKIFISFSSKRFATLSIGANNKITTKEITSMK
mgnify:CR=1 FL=1